ncbi:hypothetical protein IPG41_04045 [Candidatus Peregrinibacteria bacterium]|nr:MAG: hypothetical protein IPG41_04045 [Candidatus Peregrinibacteria bacterium]
MIRKLILPLALVPFVLGVAGILNLFSISPSLKSRDHSSNLSIEDFEQGVECQPLMMSYIENGWNSDNLDTIYGGVRGDDYFEEETNETFTLKLEGDQLIEMTSKEITFELTENDIGYGRISASYVHKGNPYLATYYIDMSGMYRYVKVNFHEGKGLKIARGYCTPHES